MVEQLHPEKEDLIAQLNVEEIYATLENKILAHPAVKLTEEKRKCIREMANFNVL